MNKLLEKESSSFVSDRIGGRSRGYQRKSEYLDLLQFFSIFAEMKFKNEFISWMRYFSGNQIWDGSRREKLQRLC